MQANVAIIESPKESVDRAYDISISAREELLVAFPTINSFLRNVRTSMSMLLLKEEYSKNNIRLRVRARRGNWGNHINNNKSSFLGPSIAISNILEPHDVHHHKNPLKIKNKACLSSY
jgi:hypothetical protein